jgi:hypothetical protein
LETEIYYYNSLQDWKVIFRRRKKSAKQTMAATDPQRQLLTLIRDFASEKSQGGECLYPCPFPRLVSEKMKGTEIKFHRILLSSHSKPYCLWYRWLEGISNQGFKCWFPTFLVTKHWLLEKMQENSGKSIDWEANIICFIILFYFIIFLRCCKFV